LEKPGKESAKKSEIVSDGSVTITTTLRQEGERAHSREKQPDCCLTAIRFKKIYPGDVTARLTTDEGRTVQREFTARKTVRTAFIKHGVNDDDDETGIVIGGLGPCVNVDVSIVDTSSVTLTIAHYKFKLCCNDPCVRPGARLTHKSPPTAGGQVVKLPLLEIVAVRRDPCP